MIMMSCRRRERLERGELPASRTVSLLCCHTTSLQASHTIPLPATAVQYITAKHGGVYHGVFSHSNCCWPVATKARRGQCGFRPARRYAGVHE